jgi:hypothetical protein
MMRKSDFYGWKYLMLIVTLFVAMCMQSAIPIYVWIVTDLLLLFAVFVSEVFFDRNFFGGEDE